MTTSRNSCGSPITNSQSSLFSPFVLPSYGLISPKNSTFPLFVSIVFVTFARIDITQLLNRRLSRSCSFFSYALRIASPTASSASAEFLRTPKAYRYIEVCCSRILSQNHSFSILSLSPAFQTLFLKHVSYIRLFTFPFCSPYR